MADAGTTVQISAKKYVVIQAGDLLELSKLVNEAITAGQGIPLGGVCSFTVHNHTGYTWVETCFCQALAL